MTEPTIRLKKSEVTSRHALRWGLLLTILVAPAALAASAKLAKLPVLQNIGVIPVQWEGETSTMPARQTIIDTFPAAVRETHRFRILNDELVSGLWQDDAGRAELREQYEAQGLISLTVTPREDLVTLTVRLMDPWLKDELLETEVVSADWLANADPKAVEEKLTNLVFRLINRLPVDVAVTSVQGSYITLSGGTEQNIVIGDQVDLVRSSVRSLHPANRTWLEFQTKPLGTAQVVDVKTYTAVAKITKQTYDRAIEVGDGARIAAIASRVKFARLAANEGLKDSGRQDTVIVSPLYNEGAAPRTMAAPPAMAPTPSQEKMASKETEPAKEDKKEAAPVATAEAEAPAAEAPPKEQAEDKPPPPEDKGPSVWDDVAKDAVSHPLIDDFNIYAGPYWWNLGGSGVPAASGKFPLILINSVGGGITRTLVYKIKTAFGGGLTYGSTSDSSYSGYQGYARIYWEDQFAPMLDGLITGWRAGGVATLQGMEVDSGAYGGGDWLSGGGFAGLLGTFPVQNDHYDWSAEFALMPLTIGRGGFAGNWKQVQSAFGYKLSFAAVQNRPARIIAWGGGFDYGDDLQTLNGGANPEYHTYDLKVIARYGF